MQVTHLSRLYESAPAYVTDQPTFINGALAATTEHEPFKLLDSLKEIEVGAQQLKSAGLPFMPRASLAEEALSAVQHDFGTPACIATPALWPGLASLILMPPSRHSSLSKSTATAAACRDQACCGLGGSMLRCAALCSPSRLLRRPVMCSPAH